MMRLYFGQQRRRTLTLGFATLAAFCVPVSLGQISNVTCLSNFDWTIDSVQETPCLVAAHLINRCTNDNYAVNTIGPSDSYFPSEGTTPCDCNTVTYSLLSACAACQGATINAWTSYSRNCDEQVAPDGQYPFLVPEGTKVPQWAFQKVSISNKFDLTLARNTGDTPEVLPGSSQSSSSSTSTSSRPGTSSHTSRSHPPTTRSSSSASTSSMNSSSFSIPVTTSSTSSTTSSALLAGPTWNATLGPFSSAPTTATTNASAVPQIQAGIRTSKKHDETIIIGSIVGGVAALALIGGILVYYCVRAKRTRADSTSSFYASERAAPPFLAGNKGARGFPDRFPGHTFWTFGSESQGLSPSSPGDLSSLPPPYMSQHSSAPESRSSIDVMGEAI